MFKQQSKPAVTPAPAKGKDEKKPCCSKAKAKGTIPELLAVMGIPVLIAYILQKRKEQKKKGLRIIISGAPASGKGTQCEGIVDTFGMVHISTGDMLRDEVKRGTALGNEAKTYMDAGKLVPDQVMINMVKQRLAQKDCQERGWLLDGFPRTGAQAEALTQAGIVPQKVLCLDVPDEVLIERVVGRRLDPETGKIYHLKFNPPPAEIASRLTHRSDDTEDKARTRLNQHKQNESAVIAAYSDRLVRLDGNRKKDVVAEDIMAVLKALKN